MKHRLLPLVAILALIALAGGCNRGGGGAGGSAEQRTLGLSISTLNNPFFVTLRDGAQAAASKAGVKLVVTDAQNDASKQQNDIQDFITKQVDAILVNPVDSDAVVPAVQAANNANIPVLALDRGASGGKLASLIASDNVQGGKMAGEELFKLVKSGNVVQLEGIPGTSAARDRGAGFKQALGAQSAIKLAASQSAEFDRTKALDVFQNLLQAHPEMKGVFAQNDEMALGAVKALGARAGTSVVVVGFDAIPDALKAIQDGKMNATIAQQPAEMGRLGVENAVKVLDGQSVQSNIQIPVKLVTKDNVAQFIK